MDEFGNVSSDLSYDTDTGYTQDASSTSDQVNSNESGFTPQTANPDATSYADVLLKGFSRTIDAISSTGKLTNTQPVQKPATSVRANTGAAPLPVIPQKAVALAVLVAIGFFLLKALK